MERDPKQNIQPRKDRAALAEELREFERHPRPGTPQEAFELILNERADLFRALAKR